MKLIYQYTEFLSYVRDSYNSAISANKALESLEANDAYSISVSLLNNAEINNGFAKQYYQSHRELERGEIEDYFEAFANFRFEFIQVIESKDQNTTWLISRKDQLEKAKLSLEDLWESLAEDQESQRSNSSHEYTPENISKLVSGPNKK